MFDAIVIGSGIGGLTTAALLTRMAGKRVLVLERNLEPGGQTRTFRRDGASWDVGVHHVGEMAPGSRMRGIVDVISGGVLTWNQLPDDYQRLVYPSFEIQIPSERTEFRDRLVARFPEEAGAIRRYVKDVRRVARWARLSFADFLVPEHVRPFLRVLRRSHHRLASMTTREYLDRNFRSPQLKSVLATQWGDYGFPPAGGTFHLHALFADHLLNGAWFPEGGSARIARSIEEVIEAGGGAVRVGCEVVRILLEEGRAVGVEVIEMRGPLPRLVEYRAPYVVSGAGAATTYGQLLPRTGDAARATAALRQRFGDTGPGHDAVSLLLKLRSSPQALGVTSQDIWVHSDLDEADSEIYTRRLFAGIPSRCQISFPSLKSGDSHIHTAEIIAFAPPDAFRRWEGQDSGMQKPGYEALKFRIGQGLLRLAETAVPGLTELTEYLELSTPLSVAGTGHHRRGAMRGPIVTTDPRHRSSLLGPVTPIAGLFLTGQDAGSAGFVGAMMGGVLAAGQIIGRRCWPDLLRMVRRGAPPSRGTAPSLLPEDKYHARFLEITRLTPEVWRLVLELSGEAPSFVAGQFARIRTGSGQWYDHTIIALRGNRLTLLSGTCTQGVGSRLVATVSVGDSTVVELPLGTFTLRETRGRRVFVATEGSLATFLAMFDEMGEELADATLVYGCRGEEHDLVRRVDSPLPAELIRCGGQERPSDVLARMPLDAERTEFYLCGRAEAVADWVQVLRERGVKDEIHHERH
ncbi:MAG: NAD(P)-binding protein [Arachnia propionica]|uniref:FAD-dependent oxidoreductase n=1 Tax=Arachnia propionica TaxID=1750 RepID=UPI002706878F|nr:NAD(P)-binding protein [Arachnia propionica]